MIEVLIYLQSIVKRGRWLSGLEPLTSMRDPGPIPGLGTSTSKLFTLKERWFIGFDC